MLSEVRNKTVPSSRFKVQSSRAMGYRLSIISYWNRSKVLARHARKVLTWLHVGSPFLEKSPFEKGDAGGFGALRKSPQPPFTKGGQSGTRLSKSSVPRSSESSKRLAKQRLLFSTKITSRSKASPCNANTFERYQVIYWLLAIRELVICYRSSVADSQIFNFLNCEIL
jgi:hypothetical protein